MNEQLLKMNGLSVKILDALSLNRIWELREEKFALF